MSKLSKLTIKGYKSIQSLENFELTNLNILLGANGAGKSNFISVFKLLANMYAQNLQLYIQKNGGADALLHYGRKRTQELKMEFYFQNNGYLFDFIPTIDNRLIFKEENIFNISEQLISPISYMESLITIGQGNSESELHNNVPAIYAIDAIESWRVYHFHDTSDTALVKQIHSTSDNLRLKTDAANLAAFLFRLKQKHPSSYQQIIKTIQLVAPFFVDFVNRDDDGYIQLEWFEKGNLDTPFKAHVLSDGTLRFMCLTTLLLQPFELMNDTIIIDEPELGLHPYALNILASLIKRAAEQKQLIVSTQSAELIDYFSANDIIVVDKIDNESKFKRLEEEELKIWLEDYTLSELWKRNIFGGRPSR